MDSPLQRIKQYIDYKGVTVAQLERSIGMSNGSFASQLKNNKSIGSDKIENILRFFPDLNPAWVFLGTGEMTNSTHETSQLEKKQLPDNKFFNAESIGILKDTSDDSYVSKNGMIFFEIGNGKLQMLMPLVESYAYAGYLQGFNEVEYLDELPKFSIIVDKYYKGIYRAFQVRGESMFDGTIQSICSGEVAVGRHISKDYWKSKFHLHQWEDYIIVHNEGIIIKRIIRHDVENGIIVCHSLNPDKDIYPDVEINLSDCLEIYNVIQTTRTRQF